MSSSSQKDFHTDIRPSIAAAASMGPLTASTKTTLGLSGDVTPPDDSNQCSVRDASDLQINPRKPTGNTSLDADTCESDLHEILKPPAPATTGETVIPSTPPLPTVPIACMSSSGFQDLPKLSSISGKTKSSDGAHSQWLSGNLEHDVDDETSDLALEWNVVKMTLTAPSVSRVALAPLDNAAIRDAVPSGAEIARFSTPPTMLILEPPSPQTMLILEPSSPPTMLILEPPSPLTPLDHSERTASLPSSASPLDGRRVPEATLAPEATRSTDDASHTVRSGAHASAQALFDAMSEEERAGVRALAFLEVSTNHSSLRHHERDPSALRLFHDAKGAQTQTLEQPVRNVARGPSQTPTSTQNFTSASQQPPSTREYTALQPLQTARKQSPRERCRDSDDKPQPVTRLCNHDRDLKNIHDPSVMHAYSGHPLNGTFAHGDDHIRHAEDEPYEAELVPVASIAQHRKSTTPGPPSSAVVAEQRVHKDHRSTSQESAMHLCPFCRVPFKFPSEETLIRHVRGTHGKVPGCAEWLDELAKRATPQPSQEYTFIPVVPLQQHRERITPKPSQAYASKPAASIEQHGKSITPGSLQTVVQEQQVYEHHRCEPHVPPGSTPSFTKSRHLNTYSKAVRNSAMHAHPSCHAIGEFACKEALVPHAGRAHGSEARCAKGLDDHDERAIPDLSQTYAFEEDEPLQTHASKENERSQADASEENELLQANASEENEPPQAVPVSSSLSGIKRAGIGKDRLRPRRRKGAAHATGELEQDTDERTTRKRVKLTDDTAAGPPRQVDTRSRAERLGKRMARQRTIKDSAAERVDESRFRCNKCGSSFVRKEDLDRHVLKHDGIEYVCPYCDEDAYGREQSRKDSLMRHVRIVHEEKVGKTEKVLFCKSGGEDEWVDITFTPDPRA